MVDLSAPIAVETPEFERLRWLRFALLVDEIQRNDPSDLIRLPLIWSADSPDAWEPSVRIGPLAIAGWTDAVGFILFAGLHVSFMVRNMPVGTMIAGAPSRLGENVADRLHGKPALILENAGQWFGFVIGAALGVFFYQFLHARDFLIPALASALVAVVIAEQKMA